MTENEYINATNLAKLRVANYTLRDCLFMDESDDAQWRGILREVAKMVEKLEGIVKCKPQYPKKSKSK